MEQTITTRIMVRRKGTEEPWRSLSGLTEQPKGIAHARAMIDRASPAMAGAFDFAISHVIEYLINFNPPDPEKL